MTDPTPATPDEAVAALRSIFGHAKACRELMPTDGRCNCMDILAAAGWSLSRQQGDTVAARVESPEDIEARVGKMLVEAATLRTIRANGLDDIHEIRHIGAALTWGNTSDCDPADCKLDRAGGWDREKLLGIGADGAGDGR